MDISRTPRVRVRKVRLVSNGVSGITHNPMAHPVSVRQHEKSVMDQLELKDSDPPRSKI
jgi:hypothetical protein